MSYERQHFLLSYFNTMSFGPAAYPLSRPALIQIELTGWRITAKEDEEQENSALH